MALAAKLQMRQSQALVMTPQLMQSIRLLQFTHVELEHFIDEEIQRNPLLERAEGEAGAPEALPDAGSEPADGAEWTAEAMSDRLDASLENVFPDDPGRRDAVGPELAPQWKSAGGGSPSGEGFDIEDISSGAPTLRQHVAEQIAFAFADRVEALVAAELADAIGMHESTVSRVTSNKYMLTPRGVFELRYFFTAAIASAEGGDAHSAEAVRDRIRGLIEQEKPADVLSDDAIVDILREGGVDIARRTVAKYREGMNIPSSVQRRREKRALQLAGR